MVDLLRERGTIYVQTPSIECLAAFLSGWFHAQKDEPDDVDLWNNFLDFVATKYNDEEHRSWHSLIGFHSLNSFEAYQKFFQHFDEALLGPEERRS